MGVLEVEYKLAIFKTNKGRWAVRPITWAVILDKGDTISEDLNHLAIFSEKEDAEEYVRMKSY